MARFTSPCFCSLFPLGLAMMLTKTWVAMAHLSCGPGEGSGEVRSHYAMCGAGGASNMGLGGDGALRREGGFGKGSKQILVGGLVPSRERTYLYTYIPFFLSR